MRRGEVYEYVVGSRQLRVMVISGEEVNADPAFAPWALTIAREPTGKSTLFTVRMNDADPLVMGVILIPAVLRVDHSALRHRYGFVAPETMAAVERGLREFLELP